MLRNHRQRLSALLKPRSVREASSAIDDELGYHLAESVDRLIDEGWSPEEARAEAERRFGDVADIRADLIERALKPNRRLTLLGAAAMLGICGVFSAVLVTQQSRLTQNESQIVQFADQLDRLRAQMGSIGSGGAGRIPMAQTVNFVTVDGAVSRPLVWTFSRRDDVTLRELISRCGGLQSTATGRISIARMRQGNVVDRVELTAEQWFDPAGPDPVLDGSYYVYVEPTVSARIDMDEPSEMTKR